MASVPSSDLLSSDKDRLPWRASVLTLFPDLFPGPLGISVIGRALDEGIWTLATHDIRDAATDKHRTVDDTPAGGGPGLVLRPDVLFEAITSAGNPDLPLLVMSPRGVPFDQPMARILAEGPGVRLVCGRFEGIDQRVIDATSAKEVSLGDYVLAGGEIAAMAVLEATIRLLPGVLGSAQSSEIESFETGLLEYPQYTRPAIWQEQPIPDVLLKGDHAKIEAWRREQAEALTASRRPDLLATRPKHQK